MNITNNQPRYRAANPRLDIGIAYTPRESSAIRPNTVAVAKISLEMRNWITSKAVKQMTKRRWVMAPAINLRYKYTSSGGTKTRLRLRCPPKYLASLISRKAVEISTKQGGCERPCHGRAQVVSGPG